MMTAENNSPGIKPGQQFLTALRAQTLPAHKQLEELPVSMSIVDPAITIEQYAKYLGVMYHVHHDAEQYVYPLLKDLFPDIQERIKSYRIKDDLGNIKQQLPGEPQLPLTARKPLMSIPFALGIMYVIEGSSLGGRVILKNITQALALSEEQGASYFSGYGKDTGVKWSTFLEVLCNYPQNAAQEEEVIAGAVYGFNRLYEFMN